MKGLAMRLGEEFHDLDDVRYLRCGGCPDLSLAALYGVYSAL